MLTQVSIHPSIQKMLCYWILLFLGHFKFSHGYSLTIGTVFPEPMASNDLGIWEGFELWREHAMQGGGIQLDNGDVIDAIINKNISVPKDQEYDGNETAQYEAAYELCSYPDINVIMCPVPYTPECVRACAPLGKVQLAQYGSFKMCSGDTDSFGNDGTYTFCIPVDSSSYSHGIMSSAKTLGYDKVAIMWYLGHPGIAAVGPVMGPNAEELFDLEVVVNTGYEDPVLFDADGGVLNYTASVVASLEKARDLEARAFIVRSYTETAYLLKILESIGYTPDIIWATVSPSKSSWMDDSFGLGDRVTTGVQWHYTAKASCPVFGSSETFSELYSLQYGQNPSYFVAMGALAGVSLHLAVQAVSATDPDSIKEGLEGINTEVFFGLLRYNRYGRNIGRDPLTLQWINGIQEVVFPVEASTASFVHPIIPWECRDEICLEVLMQEEDVTYAFRYIALVELIIAKIGMIALFCLRDQQIFKGTSPLFCELMMFFGSLCFAAVILFTITPNEDMGDMLCTCRVWLLGLAATGLLSNLFAKTFRLAKIASNQTMHRMRISNTQLLGFVLGFLAVEAIILGIWTAIDPPQYAEIIEIMTEYSGLAYPTCTFSSTFFFINLAYFVIMNIWGATLSWKVRNVPSIYNESKYINFSLYTILFVLVLLIPIQYAIDTGTETSMVITSLGVLVVMTTVLVTVIGSKFLSFCYPMTDQFQVLETRPSMANLGDATTTNGKHGATTTGGGIHNPLATENNATVSNLGISGIEMQPKTASQSRRVLTNQHLNNSNKKIVPVNDDECKFEDMEKIGQNIAPPSTT